MEKQDRTDLLIGYSKKNKDWYEKEIDNEGKIVIPIELKVIRTDFSKTEVGYNFNGGGDPKEKKLYDDALALYGYDQEKGKKYDGLNPYGILALMVTGMYKEKEYTYEEILKMAENFQLANIPKENLKLILNEEIYIKQDFTELGEETDEWVKHARAHQLVWIIRRGSAAD